MPDINNQIIVDIPDSMPVQYTDTFSANIGDGGLVLTFANITVNNPNRAIPFSRVGMSHVTAKALLNLLQNAFDQYETKKQITK